MSTLREAAQQALEALENLSDCYDGDDDYDGECASCHTRSYLPHDADCKRNNAITTLRAALAQEQAEPTGKQSLQVDHGLSMNTPQAAQRLLDALTAALPYASHRAEFDIVADAADDLRAALKREEEALAWLEERKQHWKRELDRMRSPQ